MTESTQRETADRLVRALADTAYRNLPDQVLAPSFLIPDQAGTRSGYKGKQLRPWMLPAIAATLLLAVTVVAIGIAQRSGHPSASVVPATSGQTTVITLRAQQNGTPLAVVELQAARTVISARIASSGVSQPDVRIVGNDEIQALLPGSATVDVSELGAVGLLEFRPSILGSLSVTDSSSSKGAGSAVRTVDQWQSLGFTPPADSVAYQALTEAQRDAVRSVFSSWDCTDRGVIRPDRPIVACSQDGHQKYLLGAAIVQGGQVASADVTPPTPPSPEWSVALHLQAAGQQQWTAYTTAHNEQSHAGDIANVVADVLDAKVITVSTLQATIVGDTQISDNFTQRTATQLAADLTAGSLPRQFDVTSIQHR
jgi:preprotein translocase subunit SecD